MEKLSDVYLTDYIPTIYTAPRSMYYVQNGKQRKWDIFAERNGVIIIVYNSTRDVLVLVRQFRASAYLNTIPVNERNDKIDVEKYPAERGVTLEFCAGLEDKNVSTEQVAKEEILEECGYDVPLSRLEKITMFKNLTETTGAKTTLFYCEVTDGDRVSLGGGCTEEGENIEVVEMSVKDVIEYAMNKDYVSSPVNFMYALYWFLYNKYDKKN